MAKGHVRPTLLKQSLLTLVVVLSAALVLRSSQGTGGRQPQSPASAEGRSSPGAPLRSSDHEDNVRTQGRFPSFAVPLMGVIVGGAITMLGAWLKDRRDHRRAITRWVEDEFVFGSIEPVVRALDRLRLLLKQQEASVIPIGSVGDFPTAELARIRLVLGTDAVSVFLLNAGCYSKRAATETEAARIVASLVEEQQSQLWDLEKQLLGLDLGEKKDIFKIHKSNSINQIAKLADQVTERLLQIRV